MSTPEKQINKFFTFGLKREFIPDALMANKFAISASGPGGGAGASPPHPRCICYFFFMFAMSSMHMAITAIIAIPISGIRMPKAPEAALTMPEASAPPMDR